MTKNILISGASIAGPALAYWLRRARLQPHRRRARARTCATAATRSTSAVPAMDVRRAAWACWTRSAGTHRHARRRRSSTASRQDLVRRWTPPPSASAAGDDVEILRGDLAPHPLRRHRGDVEYVFGDSITSLDRGRAAGSHVTFEHAAPRPFDLVVGADGLHSTRPRAGFRPGGGLPAPLGHYISIFSVPNFSTSTAGRLLHGRRRADRQRLQHAPGRAARRPPSCFAVAATGLRPARHRAGQQQLAGRGRSPRMGWESHRSLLAAMPEAPDFYFDSLMPGPTWTPGRAGRVALLGDAGYCAVAGVRPGHEPGAGGRLRAGPRLGGAPTATTAPPSPATRNRCGPSSQ